ncbi:MAG: hypothetical protein WCS17_06350, partial [Prevotella sp.]
DRTDICIDEEYPFCVCLTEDGDFCYFDENEIKKCKQSAMYFYDGKGWYKKIYEIFLYAKDRASAVKIAKERHMQFLALNMYKNNKYINFVTKEVIK